MTSWSRLESLEISHTAFKRHGFELSEALWESSQISRALGSSGARHHTIRRITIRHSVCMSSLAAVHVVLAAPSLETFTLLDVYSPWGPCIRQADVLAALAMPTFPSSTDNTSRSKWVAIVIDRDSMLREVRGWRLEAVPAVVNCDFELERIVGEDCTA